MFFYYNKVKASQQKLELIQTTKEPYDFDLIIEEVKPTEENPTPTPIQPRMKKDEVVVYEGETSFIGIPFVENDKVRPASVQEMVDLGIIKLREYEEVRNNEIVLKQAELPILTEEEQFELAKKTKMQEINEVYSQIAATAKVDIPTDEIYTWDIQKLEAEAWQLDSNAPTPSIDILASFRNIDRLELLEKVLVKVQAYRDFIFMLTGKRQKLEDILKLATTIEEIEAIDVKAHYM